MATVTPNQRAQGAADPAAPASTEIGLGPAGGAAPAYSRWRVIDQGRAPGPSPIATAHAHASTDRVAQFSPLITATRLATVAISLLLAGSDVIDGDPMVIGAAIAAVVYATLRAFRPIIYNNDTASLLRVMGDVALHVCLVSMTGFWASPLAFTLINAVVVAGFARGFAFAMRVATTCALSVSAASLVVAGRTPSSLREAMTWSGLILLVAAVAGQGRRLSGEAERERVLALDRLGRLADANALLFSLHRVAQTLPASLDMSDVLDSTVNRLRGLVDFDSVAVLLLDDTDGAWQVVRNEGCHVPVRIPTDDLPHGLQEAILSGTVEHRRELEGPDAGFDARARSGMYATLSARGAVMGLIAVEARSAGGFQRRDADLLAGFVPPLALALDNARWFARLRTVGADEERTRIARDLHDRIGQSLAYLAFELDRIITRHGEGDDLGPALDHLRDDVRGVIREVRDTLYDLRTDVSEDSSLAEILGRYADRVSDRTALHFTINAEHGSRLPLLQEREMWRIAQEAITNIERHARARNVDITWECDGERATITVADDGVGFEAGRSGRLDSYGMLGMRERASSIGAALDVRSTPGHGTSVTCMLDPARPARPSPDPLNGGARR